MGLGVLRRVRGAAALCLTAAALLPTGKVLAKDGNDGAQYPLIYGTGVEDGDDILRLWEPGPAYETLSGDCLWDISKKLWGDGRWYGELFEANRDTIEQPDLIYPGMCLQTGRSGYIVRKEAKYGGMQMGDYSMDLPGGWTVGTIASGEASANLVLSGTGFEKIACLIQDKKAETVLSTQDWNVCMEKVRNYVDEKYKEKVSDLVFEQYRMGQEELYLYSFLWQIDIPEQGMEKQAYVRVCMGMKLTEHIQAQFLGFAGSYDIHGGVRYVTASFREHEGYDPSVASVNGSNMAILPDTQWALEGMFDPFPWIDEFFSALLEKAAGTEPESENAREAMIKQVSRPGGR